MGTYSDYEQRLLDQQSGEEMDRQAQRLERREARDTIATAPIGPAHVFADADNNGLNARVLPAALTSNEQVEQLISEYQLAIDVRSHHTPLGRIDRIKQRCEETIAALQELQQRRSSHEAPPIPPSSNLESLIRAAFVAGIRYADGVNEQGIESVWLMHKGALVPPAETRAPLPEFHWWCPECQKPVPGIDVTFFETHDERAGGCGHKVLAQRPALKAQPQCDHKSLKLVNADGFCLVCGENVLGGEPPAWVKAAFPEDFPPKTGAEP